MRTLLISFLLILLTYSNACSQRFSVSFSSAVSSEPFTGNVFLYLSKNNRSPKDANVGLELFPCYSVHVTNVRPGGIVTFDDRAISYPVKLSDLERGEYFVQAVWDRNLRGRSIAAGPGNMFSRTSKTTFTKDAKRRFTVDCDQVVPDRVLAETELQKEVKVTSELLSDFYKRHTTIDAAVLLPSVYTTEPDRTFPVVFIIFGYGADYHDYAEYKSSTVGLDDTTSYIKVFLDGSCPWGHSVYANSDNNGPWGDALVREFIPALERTFRCNGARLVTGNSSGGWSSLWLQTHYPKVFAGCWSGSPDEVDFRSFCNANIYSDSNMFYDKDGNLKPYATIEGRLLWVYMKDAYQMENVISRGEQMHSYEAVFGKKGKDGCPERICDPSTGEIDSVTAAHWKNYDISLYLRTNWDELKKDLDGKVRVSVGEQDNFNLNAAVHLLEEEMNRLHSQFVFSYYPGGHLTVFSADYRRDGIQFLEQKYREWLDRTDGTIK